MFKLFYKPRNTNKTLISQLRSLTTESTENKQPWRPKKRVSRQTMDKIRTLAALKPDTYTMVALSQEFKLSVEGIRRILKSKYIPNEKDAERQEKNRYKAMGERKQSFKTNGQQERKK